jgi:hypothetical protein
MSLSLWGIMKSYGNELVLDIKEMGFMVLLGPSIAVKSEVYGAFTPSAIKRMKFCRCPVHVEE